MLNEERSLPVSSFSYTVEGLFSRRIAMAADDELSRKLAKRTLINDGEAQPQLNKKIPISAEFKEFSIKEIQFYTSTFKKWDANGDG